MGHRVVLYISLTHTLFYTHQKQQPQQAHLITTTTTSTSKLSPAHLHCRATKTQKNWGKLPITGGLRLNPEKPAGWGQVIFCAIRTCDVSLPTRWPLGNGGPPWPRSVKFNVTEASRIRPRKGLAALTSALDWMFGVLGHNILVWNVLLGDFWGG